MPIKPKRCGIKFDPPSVILIYENEHTNKLRKRVMPVRSFSQYSDCRRAAERLKHHPRHGLFLDSVSLEQLVRLHTVLRDHLRGLSVEESLNEQRHFHTHDEDLNKLSDEDLNKLSDEDLNKPSDEDLNKPSDEDLNKPSDEDLNKLSDEDLNKLSDEDLNKLSDEDLNKLSDEELNRHKAQMNVLFELNRRHKDDPDFVYDVEMEFPENSVRETCSWDQSDEEF